MYPDETRLGGGEAEGDEEGLTARGTPTARDADGHKRRDKDRKKSKKRDKSGQKSKKDRK